MEPTDPQSTPSSAAIAAEQAPALLAAIRLRLTTTRPHRQMTDDRRRALALTYATDAAGYLTNASAALERALLAAMPPVQHNTPITRAAYAKTIHTTGA
ncbi:hypothetical protein [Streptomyces sp. CAU 1734]|uniref:hypothetical protein n=1 Tax=Streptomyces sp. CAU 1734 TaxID=3140360 RepID=UPI0032618C0D